MIEIKVNQELWELPVKLAQQIANKLGHNLHVGIDVKYDVYVFIDELDGIKCNKYLHDLTGRGESYRSACIDYLKKLSRKSLKLQIKNKDVTKEVIEIIDSSKFVYYYDRNNFVYKNEKREEENKSDKSN